MEVEHGLFEGKLSELEQQYSWLQAQIRLFQQEDLAQICQARRQIQEEYRKHDLELDETVRSCRSHTMARLAEVQRDYGRRMEALLPADAKKSGAAGEPEQQDSAERMALYAEFSMDFATQAMRYALIAALKAMELQMQADNTTPEGGRKTL